MLQGGYLSVLQAQNRDEFREEVVRFTRSLGFETVTAMAVVDHGIARSDFVVVDNAPQAFLGAYHNSSSYLRDPVMQHCKRQSLPIIWDQATYTAQGQGDLWEEQARFGYQTGIAMALHLPEGRHFLLGVDRDRALPNDRGELTRVVADLQLFAVHALDAAMRVLVPTDSPQDLPSLTPRELEALRWTMDGKTAWEVGSILGVTERTAVLHLNNAMHKLGCVNKHQAVLKALRLGMLR
jgi:DNA-binding CsgD family transcriptional regulator